MLRKGTWSALPAALLALSLLGAPGAASAGEPGKACHCAHGAKAASAATPAADAALDAHPAAEQAAAHEALVKEGRKLLAAKCDCGSKADCTCKKGQCKCSKCGGRHQVLEALQDSSGGQPAQDAQRYDASAGVLL